MPGPDRPPDKFAAALEVLNRARGAMLDRLADAILERSDDFAEGGFQVNEFLEFQGSRLHFLCLMIGQFELASEALAIARSGRDPEAGPGPRGRDDDPRAPHGEEAGNDP